MNRCSLVLALLGCALLRDVASADADRDRLHLHTGAVIEGQVVGTHEGRYWLRLDSGELASYPFTEIARIELDDRDALAAPTAAPPPEERCAPPAACASTSKAADNPVEVGLEISVWNPGVGARVAWNLEGDVVDSVGLRASQTRFGSLFIPYFSGALVTQEAMGVIDFIGGSPWQIEVGAGVGRIGYISSSTLVASSWYKFIATSVAARYESPGPFQINVGWKGIRLEEYLMGPALRTPDVTASFVW